MKKNIEITHRTGKKVKVNVFPDFSGFRVNETITKKMFLSQSEFLQVYKLESPSSNLHNKISDCFLNGGVFYAKFCGISSNATVKVY